MASSYLQSYRAAREQERDQKIAKEEIECTQRAREIERERKKNYQYSKGVGYVLVVCVIGAWIFLGFSFESFLVGVAAGVLTKGIVTGVGNSAVDSHNGEVDRKINARKQELEEQKQRLSRECEQAVDKEKQRYLSVAKTARRKYGGSTVMAPLVKWMADRFERQIRTTDRKIYVKQIQAKLSYRVLEDRIEVLSQNPHQQTQSVDDTFSFRTNGLAHYNDLPDFLDRVGFAQALSKQIEVEIAKRFPCDPVKPIRGVRPKLKIEYDDCNIDLIYTVRNPDYTPPVNLGKGISGR